MKIIYLLSTLMVLFSCGEEQLNKNVSLEKEIVEVPLEPLRVEIYGEQFKWAARYAGEDNILGKFDYKLVNERNPLGLKTTKSIAASLIKYEEKSKQMAEMSLTAEVKEDFLKEQSEVEKILRLLNQIRDKHPSQADASAENDFIVEDTLVLCVKQEYEFYFRSKDVIHSAYFPEFRAQINVVPGMITRFKFTPDETTDERRLKLKNDKFDYNLICNKICGSGHYKMRMTVRVVNANEYLKWVKGKSKLVFANLEPC